MTMLTIKKKPLTPNIIWDVENNRPLCKFNNKGIIETDDKILAEKLKALGHEVTGEVDAIPLDKMKIDELKSYAAENGIDLGEATTKADILKVIKDTENNR